MVGVEWFLSRPASLADKVSARVLASHYPDHYFADLNKNSQAKCRLAKKGQD
jgi:hypothetical protein